MASRLPPLSLGAGGGGGGSSRWGDGCESSIDDRGARTCRVARFGASRDMPSLLVVLAREVRAEDGGKPESDCGGPRRR